MDLVDLIGISLEVIEEKKGEDVGQVVLEEFLPQLKRIEKLPSEAKKDALFSLIKITMAMLAVEESDHRNFIAVLGEQILESCRIKFALLSLKIIFEKDTRGRDEVKKEMKQVMELVEGRKRR